MTAVVIVGGGAMGAALAWTLVSDPGFDGAVTVLERDPTYATASTTLSAAGIRTQFSAPENIRLSRYGWRFLERAGDLLGVDVGLRERGYLTLASDPATLRANHAVQIAEGASVALLTPEALAARFPWLSVEGVALGALGLKEEGWFDAATLLQGWRASAIRRGARFETAEATGFHRDGDRVVAVETTDGRVFPCAVAANCAGPWAGRVAAWAGVTLPVRPGKRTVFHFLCREAAEAAAESPLVVDVSGVWMRPEGAGFIAGVSPAPEADPEAADFDPEWALFEERIWPALATRAPCFEAVRVVRAWAGWYEMNDWDANALLGPAPGAPNLLHAAGFSGHGVQQAAGAARVLADRIVHGRSLTISAEALSADRFAKGRRVRERAVI
ncbi:MAG: FAD-binding oxidoreductase [Rhodobacteraceae bacterium]|nr:MAG: FAD-binding oxidoreductase [Paracoccaceae bacterium]